MQVVAMLRFMKRMKKVLLGIALAVLGQMCLLAQTGGEIERGANVSIIGNTLADRMQHHGWLESLIHRAYPEKELRFRNLGFSGDEIVTRLRSANFGSPDQWLEKMETDVIFAFFGFNESFNGPEGLPRFIEELDQFIKHTLNQKYNGNTAPKLVLFSPVAHEDLNNPDLPDGSENNRRLSQYVSAMAEVAEANRVQFINLFELSLRAYESHDEPLTMNGVHLTDRGDKILSPEIFQELFGSTPSSMDDPLLRSIRAAVLDRNWEWFNRYRTIDGFNVYGGRSQLEFDNITNYKVMQEEMAARDILTANRDKVIWATAQGKRVIVDDSNLPEITPVPTNKPGPNPDGSHVFLGGEEAIEKMTPADGCEVNLFASEEQFPDLVNPVQMAWDTQGRLWVATWRNYPERSPKAAKGDGLLIFEDVDGDGRADKMTPFLDDLNAPTGFQFYRDGVMVMQAPDLWFVRDTDGDDRGDWKENILNGMDSADSHHTTNAMVLDPGGGVYLSDGVFHRTQVETIYGLVRNIDGAIYRFEPRTFKFERYVPYGFANPHGRVFDHWGNDIITDATGNANYFGPAFSGYLDYPDRHRGMRQFWDRPSRPCAGTGMLYSRHFPAEFQGNFLNCNVIGYLGIFRADVTEEGSGLKGETIQGLVESSDPNFRPADVKVGPDGAVYFLDWHNPIIGHMQHHLRDPSRDHTHGRVYRVTYKGRPLLDRPKIHGQSIVHLLDLLKVPELATRDLAKIELSLHPTDEVMEALDKWVKGLDKADPEFEHHMAEALWVKQYFNVVDTSLLRRMLTSPDHRARAAATRVLCYQRDRVPEVLDMLRQRANDEHPRVRLEAIRAASFFRNAEAADLALDALKYPADYYIEYTMGETIRQLEPWWRKAISEGRPLASNNPEGIRFLLQSVNDTELLKLPRTEEVLNAILTRQGVVALERATALDELAMNRGVSASALLIDLIKDLDHDQSAAARDLTTLLLRQPAADLKPIQAELLSGIKSSTSSRVRESFIAALIVAEGSVEGRWKVMGDSVSGLTTLMRSIPLVPDPTIRAGADGAIRRLLEQFPHTIQSQIHRGQGSHLARYVRVSLPRRGTLTLAEVEVFSGGNNIARSGKASQSSTSNNGHAGKAIDGNTHGSFGNGGQTHSNENEDKPWWELDLGQEMPIESIVIWNRTESNLGRRLQGFDLEVMDAGRQTIFVKSNHPAPETSARIEISSDPEGTLKRAAMMALVSTGERPADSFSLLAKAINQGDQRNTAALAIKQLPRSTWNQADAGHAARSILGWAKGVPATARTSRDFVETTQTALELASYLEPAEAALIRGELLDLGVNVYVIKTVLEQMRYDTTRLVVEAGKPFEIVFENNDVMPHNLLVVQPGGREKVGTMAQTMPYDALDAQGRTYVPQTDLVLAATKMLEPGEQETLKMTAPIVPGEYTYVCTFPGHWTIMWGYLIVTPDVETYLKENPKAPEIGPGGHTDHVFE